MDYDEHLSFAQVNEKLDIIMYQNKKILDALGNKTETQEKKEQEDETRKTPKPQEKPQEE